MKHVKFADKSLLMDDETADRLLEYAQVLADTSHADSVSLRAISPDGNTIEGRFLLNSASVMLVESTNSEVNPPDNAEAVKYMTERIRALKSPPVAQPEAESPDTDDLASWEQDMRA
ncbi:hypothetical protein [Microbacterium sp. R86528]|uniref:hypothetical protein n=1 Tax=Microbacterium sp. R86528 TaxID=3093864 RepID=UPI0037C6FD42